MLGLFESNAALSHIEFALAVLGELGGEPLHQFWRSVESHMIQPYMVLLRGDADKWKRQFRITVVACRVNGMRHDITDHPIGHRLHDATIWKMVENGAPQCARDLPALRRKLFQVFFRGGRVILKVQISVWLLKSSDRGI